MEETLCQNIQQRLGDHEARRSILLANVNSLDVSESEEERTMTFLLIRVSLYEPIQGAKKSYQVLLQRLARNLLLQNAIFTR